jgi:hypothetical protein
MKTRTLSAVFTFAALTAIAGSAVAGAHDGYNNAFYGTKSDNASEMAGKAAYGTPSGDAWSGHEAYKRGTGGGTGAPLASAEVMGKAAYGSTSGPDGNAIYRRALGSSD